MFGSIYILLKVILGHAGKYWDTIFFSIYLVVAFYLILLLYFVILLYLFVFQQCQVYDSTESGEGEPELSVCPVSRGGPVLGWWWRCLW